MFGAGSGLVQGAVQAPKSLCPVQGRSGRLGRTSAENLKSSINSAIMFHISRHVLLRDAAMRMCH